MPPKRRVPKGRRNVLTWEQEIELWLGQRSDNQSAFDSDKDRREAWNAHRDTLMQDGRCWAWWRYDCPKHLQDVKGAGHYAELEALESAGLLTEQEQRDLAAYRKREAERRA